MSIAREDTLEYITLNSIQANRSQPRSDFNDKELEELADSIDEDGLIQPIIVRKIDDGEGEITHEIIAGERRLRAHQLLKKRRIKCIVKLDIQDDASQVSALIENIQRSDLNPIEEAKAISTLMKSQKLTQQQAGQKLGKSRGYISNSLRLNKLPEEIQDFVSKGELDKWHALLLASIPKEHQIELAKKAVDKAWSIDKLKAEIGKIETKADAVKKTKPVPKNEDFMILVECADKDELTELKKALKEGDYNFWTSNAVLKKLDEILHPTEEPKE